MGGLIVLVVAIVIVIIVIFLTKKRRKNGTYVEFISSKYLHGILYAYGDSGHNIMNYPVTS